MSSRLQCSVARNNLYLNDYTHCFRNMYCVYIHILLQLYTIDNQEKLTLMYSYARAFF